MDEEILRQIEQIIDYQFSDDKLLSKAIAHSSGVDNRIFSNERLEFLGDSVLGLVICQTLFDIIKRIETLKAQTRSQSILNILILKTHYYYALILYDYWGFCNLTNIIY